MKNLRIELSALAEKWRKTIADYDAAHVNSSDPEDWVGPIRDCLLEVDILLRDTAETPEERIKRRLIINSNVG
jgi:hypothetical protein